MGFIAMKCPSCGADFQLDDSREFGFCNYCGTKVMQEKIIVEHRGEVSVDGIARKENLKERASTFLRNREFTSASEYYNKCLDLDPKDFDCHFGLTLAELQVSDTNELISKVVKKEIYISYVKQKFQAIAQFADSSQKDMLNRVISDCEIKLAENKEESSKSTKFFVYMFGLSFIFVLIAIMLGVAVGAGFATFLCIVGVIAAMVISFKLTYGKKNN